MSAEMLSESLTLALPELILAIGAMVLLMVGVFAPAERANSTVTGLAVAVLIGVLGYVLSAVFLQIERVTLRWYFREAGAQTG